MTEVKTDIGGDAVKQYLLDDEFKRELLERMIGQVGGVLSENIDHLYDSYIKSLRAYLEADPENKLDRFKWPVSLGIEMSARSDGVAIASKVSCSVPFKARSKKISVNRSQRDWVNEQENKGGNTED